MRQCNGQDEYWVCGQDPSDCTTNFTLPWGYIDDRRAVSVSAIEAIPSVYSAETRSVTVTATVTTSVYTVSGSSTSSSASSGSDKSTTVGLGVGLGVGLALLAMLIPSLFLLYRAHKKIKALRDGYQMTGGEMESQPRPNNWQPNHEADSADVYEAPGSQF